jgi:tetratricopeptide (TPR) repeat protein
MRINLFFTYLVFILCSICTSCNQSNNSQNTLENARLEIRQNLCMPDLIDTLWYVSGKEAPLFDGLDGIHFNISTSSPKTLKYFNQGMMLAYGFNHAEAARSFYEAARQDTTCAMSWWGYALVLGPNYNFGMEDSNLKLAYNAIQKAKRLALTSHTQKEKDLINALSARYSIDNKPRRTFLDSAYVESMRKVYLKYPEDVDIAALYAESMMDLHPWDLFLKDGSMQPWTPEILEVIENGLERSPDHPGLNHFYIHAVEMSQHAEKALQSADKLGKIAPGSSHLVHMPSHIYIRIGKYHNGVIANLNAVLVDSMYTEACHANGVYPLLLYPHNYHFLSACATLCGASRYAIIGAEKTKIHAYNKLILDPAWSTYQHFYSIPLFVKVKFGMWDDIKKIPEPEAELIYPRIIWHYSQGMAYLAGENYKKANSHLSYIKTLMKDPELKSLSIFGLNSLFDITRIASLILEGEISAKKGDYQSAYTLLSSAVKFEDELKYQEPPDWFFSVRHNLGAVLIESGEYRDAISVYMEDLKTFPENGWALKGLVNSYAKLGDQQKYNEFKDRFESAWQHADKQIQSSRIL